ncbi:MAG: 4Fe-4S dicluster domain-containing protein [Chloroflexi bacterium]|nr:4Fe-4S dicluster domain-containing protein [Chloroflexota bacterium]
MGTDSLDVRQEENRKKWRLSRRRLLQIMGVAGATALATQVAPALMGKAPANGAEGEASPKRLRRWSMIIDLRRCDGCQSQNTPPKCTTACIEGRFTPEPMEWIEVYEHEMPGGGTQFLPTPCMQCQNPPCVNVCPVGATWSTPEGHVLIDQRRCIGCRMCMAACPYERRFFTWGQPAIPAQSLFIEYSPEHQQPMKKGVVYKCDFCPEMARAGRLPMCVQGCPQHAIYYGDLEEDLATNGEDVIQFSSFIDQNNAFRYKEDLGTEPRVYYIPGHGEAAGRKPETKGKLQNEWKWQQKVQGATTWKRSGT